MSSQQLTTATKLECNHTDLIIRWRDNFSQVVCNIPCGAHCAVPVEVQQDSVGSIGPGMQAEGGRLGDWHWPSSIRCRWLQQQTGSRVINRQLSQMQEGAATTSSIIKHPLGRGAWLGQKNQGHTGAISSRPCRQASTPLAVSHVVQYNSNNALHGSYTPLTTPALLTIQPEATSGTAGAAAGAGDGEGTGTAAGDGEGAGAGAGAGGGVVPFF